MSGDTAIVMAGGTAVVIPGSKNLDLMIRPCALGIV
jgi:hypothetical protein